MSNPTPTQKPTSIFLASLVQLKSKPKYGVTLFNFIPTCGDRAIPQPNLFFVPVYVYVSPL